MKKSCGFTLVEVVIAIGVLTASIFFISEIILKSLVRIQENQDNLEKVFIIKRELYLNFLKIPINEKKVITRLDSPPVTLTTELGVVNNKSCLKNYKDTIKIMTTNVMWKRENKLKEYTMSSFVFIPKQETKK